MAQGAVSSTRWKWLLLALCSLALFANFASIAETWGLGGAPWFGYWDVFFFPTAQPYVVKFDPPQPGGAADRAGIRAGDWVDVREQTLDARIALYAQPMAGRPIPLVIHRAAQRLTTRIRPSSAWEAEVGLKLWGNSVPFVWVFAFLACAFLIALRRSALPEGRALALILLSFAGPAAFVVPSPMGTLIAWILLPVFTVIVTALLSVALSSSFGVRSPLRRVLELCAYAAVGAFVAAIVAFVYALLTLKIDPMLVGFGDLSSPVGLTALLTIVVDVCIVAVASAAVATTDRSERPRAAWLLLPIPLMLLMGNVWGLLQNFAHTWAGNQGLTVLSNVFWLLGAFAVTYALLKRRVLDFEFVLSRTLVFAIVSLIVVVAFTLLEWVLGTVLTGVSHATSFVANAALALVLGLSLRYIHIRADAFVDRVFFRKRHDDERALLDFSREAAYVTSSNALLDQAIENVRTHTDARNAAVLLDTTGTYAAVRSFGDGVPAEVEENDAAILALKSWHKPLDPHRYATTLQGALAVPMLARGRLAGVLVLGERAGGEAYAPDEVEALSQFAHGVGSALDVLSTSGSDSLTSLKDTIAAAMTSMQELIVELRAQRRPAT